MFTTKNFLFLHYQPQEEEGSAEGQPASNKADGDDCRSDVKMTSFTSLFYETIRAFNG